MLVHVHLLHSCLFFLKVSNFAEGRFSDGDILCRSKMQVDLHLINVVSGLLEMSNSGTKFSFLGEEILKEDNNWGLHLFKDILIDNLFCDFVSNTCSSCSD